MTCRDGVPFLIDYTEGALAASVRGALEAHVRRCSRCRRFLRSYLDVPRLIREATSARLPAALARRLLRITRGG